MLHPLYVLPAPCFLPFPRMAFADVMPPFSLIATGISIPESKRKEPFDKTGQIGNKQVL